ncbi:MAG: hypothetical protein JXB50_03190 [Spirochaetes bacterium]|nr:hypothetical protein [Spirochaetota bacterium]
MEILQSDEILREEILNDAKIKAERIIKKAKNDTDELEKNSVKQLSEFEAVFKENIQKELDQEIKLKLASVDIESNKEILKYCGDFLNEVYDDVKSNIINNKDFKYKEIIIKLIKKSAEKMDTSSYFVEINKDELKKISKDELLSIKLKNGRITEIIESNKNEILLYSSDKKLVSYISIDGFLNEILNEERTKIYKILTE